MLSKNLMQKNRRNAKSDNMLNPANDVNNKNANKNNTSMEIEDNNVKVPISINKKIKSIFKYVLEEYGMDIMNPKNFIDVLLNMYLEEEHLTQETKEDRLQVEHFVRTFIFLLVNWKFSYLEKTFNITDSLLKHLLKKQILKCYYLSNLTIDEYRKKARVQCENFKIIFEVIKSIEYKYSMPIVGLESYQKKNNNDYSLEIKYNWHIKFVDYIIILYLSDDSIISFSNFINGKKMNDLIETFDKENNHNLNYFYLQENKENFIKKIIYVVENVIYNLIKRK